MGSALLAFRRLKPSTPATSTDSSTAPRSTETWCSLSQALKGESGFFTTSASLRHSHYTLLYSWISILDCRKPFDLCCFFLSDSIRFNDAGGDSCRRKALEKAFTSWLCKKTTLASLIARIKSAVNTLCGFRQSSKTYETYWLSRRPQLMWFYMRNVLPPLYISAVKYLIVRLSRSHLTSGWPIPSSGLFLIPLCLIGRPSNPI